MSTELTSWSNMRAFFRLFFLICAVPLLTGTTFIIKEGGKEVGRYEEPDGKDEEKVVEQDPANPLPVRHETRVEPVPPVYNPLKAADTGKLASSPGTWTFSGRLRHLLTLDEVNSGRLVADDGVNPRIEIPVRRDGSFQASLPALPSGSYSVSFVPPPGVAPALWLYRPGTLFTKSLEDRADLTKVEPFASAVTGDSVNMEAGVLPLAPAES